MEKTTILTDHVLYGLDRAILDYLGPALEAMLGKPFHDYCEQATALAKEAATETEQIGKELAYLDRPDQLELQEQILPPARARQATQQAWAILMDTASYDQRELCSLYQEILAERHDLERMALALQVARDEGSASHAIQVEKVLGIGEDIAPSWWSSST